MRKNCRRSNKMRVVAGQTVRFGAAVVLLFVMIILNLLAHSRCCHQQKAIGQKEKLLARLEADRVRENSRWENLLTKESLDRALRRHGLSMRYPHPDQYVKMRADGTPLPHQANLIALRRRTSAQPVAKVSRGGRR